MQTRRKDVVIPCAAIAAAHGWRGRLVRHGIGITIAGRRDIWQARSDVLRTFASDDLRKPLAVCLLRGFSLADGITAARESGAPLSRDTLAHLIAGGAFALHDSDAPEAIFLAALDNMQILQREPITFKQLTVNGGAEIIVDTAAPREAVRKALEFALTC